jgi:cytochrome c biogenesis factor
VGVARGGVPRQQTGSAVLGVLRAVRHDVPDAERGGHGTRITVAGPFYNTWMAPVGLILLFLTGVGPLLAWRKSTRINLRDQFLFPTSLAVSPVVVLAVQG